MDELLGSPYTINSEAQIPLEKKINDLTERTRLLRSGGKLTPETLERYYGKKRFEQVAESNAIEGSTLSVGETELAVLKGITITGHDEGFVKDAVALDAALTALLQIAKTQKPIDILEVKGIHEQIVIGKSYAGSFRRERVQIRGASYTPPKTWEQIISMMEAWEKWSSEKSEINPLIRATILHAWLVHIHPFLDGNGRTARAVTTLELVRSGLPPLIIKKKERDRYIDALANSDEAGNIAPFFELMLEKASGALTGLELSAREIEGYDPIQVKLREVQKNKQGVWNASVRLLYEQIVLLLKTKLEQIQGTIKFKSFDSDLDFENYISLCQGKSIESSWVLIVDLIVPAMKTQSFLLWEGYRSSELRHEMQPFEDGGPALFWSTKNPLGFPTWVKAEDTSPGGITEMTNIQGKGDQWFVKQNGLIRRYNSSELAETLVSGMLDRLF